MARSRFVSGQTTTCCRARTTCATCQVPGGRLRTSTNHRRRRQLAMGIHAAFGRDNSLPTAETHSYEPTNLTNLHGRPPVYCTHCTRSPHTICKGKGCTLSPSSYDDEPPFDLFCNWTHLTICTQSAPNLHPTALAYLGNPWGNYIGIPT